MHEPVHEYGHPPVPPRLPDTVQACRVRLLELQDEMASIRIQIATTDIRRQAEKKPMDANWFHRAKTALRLKQQEQALVSAQLMYLNGTGAGTLRDRFKDALIEVLRAQHDEDSWADILRHARSLHATRQGKAEGGHG
jgi:hypothetical protein